MKLLMYDEENDLPTISDILYEYKDNELEIVFVGNYNVRLRPYYCKVIFHCKIDSVDHYPEAYMLPEQLYEQYIVGTKFKNRKCIGLGDGVKENGFHINNPDELGETKKIRDVIDTSEISLINDSERNEEYFLNQNCFVLKGKNGIVETIIPHYVIANYFYFKTTRLKNTIFEGRLYDLCYENSYQNPTGNSYKMRLKQNLINIEREVICYLQANDFSFSQYKSFISHRTTTSLQKINYTPIRAEIPFRKNDYINTLYKTIQDKENKYKLLVLHIYDDGFFMFGKIKCEIDDRIKETDLDNENGTGTLSLTNPRDSGSTSDRKPSSGNTKAIRNKFSLNKYRRKSSIQHTEIPIKVPNDKGNKIDIQDSFEEVAGSFEEAGEDGAEDVRPIGQEPSSEEKSEANPIPYTRMFEISEFNDLYNALKKKEDVRDTYLSDYIDVQPKVSEDGNTNPYYYTSKDILRRFLYGCFKYEKKYVVFLELEHSANWKSISTWFFIFENGFPNKKFFHLFLYKYLSLNKNLKEIESEYLSKNKVEFFSNNHTETKLLDDDKQKQKEISKWVDILLNRIKNLAEKPIKWDMDIKLDKL